MYIYLGLPVQSNEGNSKEQYNHGKAYHTNIILWTPCELSSIHLLSNVFEYKVGEIKREREQLKGNIVSNTLYSHRNEQESKANRVSEMDR